MGTEILKPHDCLIDRIRVSPCRRRNYFYANHNSSSSNNSSCSYNTNSRYRYYHESSPRFNRKLEQRKRQLEQQGLISKRSASLHDLKSSKNHGSDNHSFATEKVTVLRRGESLDSINRTGTATFPKTGEIVVTRTDRLGPDPKMVPKQVRIVDNKSPVAGKCDVYAGSGFAMSPAPSSLPLPSFSKKKQVLIDDSATRDLRRLLRLDF